MRIVKGREATLRLYVEDEDGDLIAATGTPTVVVTRASNGAAVSGIGAVSNPSTGLYEAVLPSQTQFDRLTALWSYEVSGSTRSTTAHYTVVAERLVPLRILKTDPKIAALSPAPTSAQLLDLVQVIEDWINRAMKFPYCEESFTRTFRIKKPTQQLMIPQVVYPRTITSVTLDDVAFSAEEVEDIKVNKFGVERGVTAWSFLTGTTPSDGGWAPGRYVITGTHGPSPDAMPDPADLRRAALTLARYAIRTNNWSERARQVQTQDAILTFSMPSADRPTGLPEVDAVVGGYGHKPVV